MAKKTSTETTSGRVLLVLDGQAQDNAPQVKV